MRRAGVNVERGLLVSDALDCAAASVIPQRTARGSRRTLPTPQDQASQALVGVLDPRPDEQIADVAAAPGGKATAIAERVGPDGAVVAVDIDAGRLRLVAEASDRLGLDWVEAVLADGRALPFADMRFDRVLLDAPCSGLGVLRRRPDARWRVGESSIGELAALQRDLLACGGRCSFAPVACSSIPCAP